MAKADVDAIIGRGDAIAREISTFVSTDPGSIQFRADLAGLLVVAIVASYESAVKEVLISYAARHHSQFAVFTQNNYERLNSRISISDLYQYASTFDNSVHSKFGAEIDRRTNKISLHTGKNIKTAYKQILSWRHDFAHAGRRNTTVEEALQTHKYSRHVIYAFDVAFS